MQHAVAGRRRGERHLPRPLQRDGPAAHRSQGEELDRRALHVESPAPDAEVRADRAVVERGRRRRWVATAIRVVDARVLGLELLADPRRPVRLGVQARVDGELVGHALVPERGLHVDVHGQHDVLERDRNRIRRVLGAAGDGVVHEPLDEQRLAATVVERPPVHGQVARHVAAEVGLVDGRVAQRDGRHEERARAGDVAKGRHRGGAGNGDVGRGHRRLRANRRGARLRVEARREQEVVGARDRANAREDVGVLEAVLVGAEPAERRARQGPEVAPGAHREMALDIRDQLVEEVALEAGRRGVVGRMVTALGVARVPVGPVAVEPGRGAEAAGHRPAVGRDEHQADGRLGHPRGHVRVVPGVGHRVGVDGWTLRQRHDPR